MAHPVGPTDGRSEPPAPTPRGGRHMGIGPKLAVGLCIAAPLIALTWVGSYSSASPHLWGFPFFYWYQMLWVFLAAISTTIAYRILRHPRRPPDRSESGGYAEPPERRSPRPPDDLGPR